MMTINQEIYTALSISKYTLEHLDDPEKFVPVLLMSGPGYGKTTAIQCWAKEHGYHLETLIGSRFTPEEIMGYQVNEPGVAELVHKNPKWYSRVMNFKARGVPTVLFTDEVTATPMQTQGPFFDLIFNRTSGDGNKLPDDTIIIAAGNYALNLSSEHNVLSPLINRFCIINLQENRTSMDVINEFLRPREEVKTSTEPMVLSSEVKAQISDEYYNLFKKLIASYSDRDSANGILDFGNQDFGNIYQDGERSVYNFWTGRSMSYLERMVEACVASKITNKDFVSLICDGLGGNGTCTFASNTQRDKYRKVLASSVTSLIGKFVNELSIDKTKAAKTLNKNATVAESIQDFLMNKEMVNDLFADNSQFVDTYTKIMDTYGNVVTTAKDFETWDETKRAQFISDMDSLRELISVLQPEDSKEIFESLVRVHQDHLTIYSGLSGVSPKLGDYKDTYGVYTPRLIQEIKLAKMKKTPRSKDEVYKVAVRETGGTLLFPMGTDTLGINVTLAKNINKSDVDYFLKFGADGKVTKEKVN